MLQHLGATHLESNSVGVFIGGNSEETTRPNVDSRAYVDVRFDVTKSKFDDFTSASFVEEVVRKLKMEKDERFKGFYQLNDSDIIMFVSDRDGVMLQFMLSPPKSPELNKSELMKMMKNVCKSLNKELQRAFDSRRIKANIKYITRSML